MVEGDASRQEASQTPEGPPAADPARAAEPSEPSDANRASVAAPASKSTEWLVAVVMMIVIGLTLAWFVRFVKS